MDCAAGRAVKRVKWRERGREGDEKEELAPFLFFFLACQKAVSLLAECLVSIAYG